VFEGQTCSLDRAFTSTLPLSEEIFAAKRPRGAAKWRFACLNRKEIFAKIQKRKEIFAALWIVARRPSRSGGMEDSRSVDTDDALCKLSHHLSSGTKYFWKQKIAEVNRKVKVAANAAAKKIFHLHIETYVLTTRISPHCVVNRGDLRSWRIFHSRPIPCAPKKIVLCPHQRLMKSTIAISRAFLYSLSSE
jgi:hypothetical protein